jgi:hypothetical protein
MKPTVDGETLVRQLDRFKVDFSKAHSRKDVLFLLSQAMKPLPMVAAAYAWEEFAKRLEEMADEGSPNVPKFRKMVIELYAAYYRGAAYWIKHGMPGAVIDCSTFYDGSKNLPAEQGEQNKFDDAHAHTPIRAAGVAVVRSEPQDQQDDHNNPK